MLNYYRTKPSIALKDGKIVTQFYTYRKGFPVRHHLVLGNRADAYAFALSLLDGIRGIDSELLS